MIEEVLLEDKKVVLVGTAHVSKGSVEEVEKAIQDYSPDRLCVELDKARYRSIRGEKDWESTDILDAISEGDGYLLLFRTLLSVYQRKLGQEFDVSPGSEMVEAINLAEEKGIEFSLIDRDINTTFSRAKESLTFTEKLKLFFSFFEGFFASSEDVDLDELTEGDILTDMLEEFGGRFPALKSVFIDERDVFMADRIREAEGENVVAVVGAGHVEGIKKNLEDEKGEGKEIRRVSGGSFPVLKGLKYGIPALVIGLFVYGFAVKGFATGKRMFDTWFLLNGSMAGLGAVFSGAHLLTVFVSFFAAPFTSVNPALPAGLVAVFAENRLRPLRVGDVESLSSISSFSGLWRNRASRLLVIFFLVNLGSSIATFAGAGSLAHILNIF